MSKAVLLLALFLTARIWAGEPALPESPKDDEHWYPEFPGGKDDPHESLPNGNFDEARAGEPRGPKGWAHPDGFTAFWKEDPAAPEHGKAILLDTDVLETEAKKRQAELRTALEKKQPLAAAPAKTPVAPARQYSAIGGTYGVSFYSEKIKCKPRQAYKISFDYKGPGGGAKVWVRGWGQSKDQQGAVHDRRLWETIVFCRVKSGGWRHFEQACHPTRRGKDKFIEVAFLRVMLYAYWPRGQYWFDTIKLEEISDSEYERLKQIPADER